MTQTSEQQRPLMTFALVCYNQEEFITEAVQGAFNQTYSPLEIILSDDCSTDGTFGKLQALAAEYQGPHQLVVRQTPSNLGLAAHINTVMSIAKGELIIGAAGDDVSLSHRAERVYEAYVASGKTALSIYSGIDLIYKDGQPRTSKLVRPPTQEQLTLQWFASRHSGVTGASQAWHRSVFDFFGPMNERIIHEDWIIPFRAALLGCVEFIDEPLVLYRQHDSNLFQNPRYLTRTGQFEYFEIFNKGNEAVFENRLRDLQRLFDVYPERKNELSNVEEITRRMLWEQQEENKLIHTNIIRRYYIILRAGFHGTPLRRLVRWSMMYLFPRVYFWYRRMRHRW